MHTGHKLTVGTRPEHITLVASDQGGLAAQVQVVEQLGSESYLHLLTGFGDPLTVRVNDEKEVRSEQQVHLNLDPGFFHLFASNGDAVQSSVATSIPSLDPSAR